MRRRSSRILVWLGLAAAVLVAADVLLWRWSEAQLRDGFAAWADAQRADGYTVTAGPARSSGWPLAAEMRISELSLSGPLLDLPVNATWTAQAVLLRIALLHPQRLVIAAAGDQHLRLDAGLDLPFTAEAEQMIIPLQPGVPAHSATLEVTRLRAGGALAGLTVAHLRADSDLKPAALQGEPALSLTASATDITLPQSPQVSWPLGRTIASMMMAAAVTGPMPPTPALTARATGWRDGGGTFEVQRATLRWGPLDLTGSATLALDEHLQPMGAATAKIKGYVATLDALAAGHLIPPQAALAAKAVLGLMAHTPEGGGAPEVEVPLTLQNRTLSLGRIPLARLPEFSWPDAP